MTMNYGGTVVLVRNNGTLSHQNCRRLHVSLLLGIAVGNESIIEFHSAKKINNLSINLVINISAFALCQPDFTAFGCECKIPETSIWSASLQFQSIFGIIRRCAVCPSIPINKWMAYSTIYAESFFFVVYLSYRTYIVYRQTSIKNM